MDNIRYTVKNVVDGKTRSEKGYEIPDRVTDVRRLIAEVQRDDALVLKDIPNEVLERSGSDHEKKIWSHHEQKITEHARKMNELFDNYNELKKPSESGKLDDEQKKVFGDLEKLLIREGIL